MRGGYTLSGEIEIAGDRFGPGQLLVLRAGDQNRNGLVVDASTPA